MSLLFFPRAALCQCKINKALYYANYKMHSYIFYKTTLMTSRRCEIFAHREKIIRTWLGRFCMVKYRVSVVGLDVNAVHCGANAAPEKLLIMQRA